jgi:hypothetical protein
MAQTGAAEVNPTRLCSSVSMSWWCMANRETCKGSDKGIFQVSQPQLAGLQANTVHKRPNQAVQVTFLEAVPSV